MAAKTSGPAGRVGRPQLSSRAAIEEAAGELFLENSYARTTIEHITMRAGVSRASFFNYFAAKSDLLWGDVDLLVSDVRMLLARQPSTIAPMDGVRAALNDATAGIGAERIPLAVTQWEIMGAREELLMSGLPRFATLASAIGDYLQRSSRADTLAVRAAAFAVVGAVAAAGAAWSAAGPGRGSLAARIDAAITPVCDGFSPTITASR